MSSGSPIQIPGRLPLLLTHEGVLLPGSTMRTSVDSARNLQLVRSRLLKGTSLQSTILGVIPNTPDPASDAADLPPLHRIGTAALAVQVVGSNWPKPHYTLLVTGLCRFQIVQLLKERPYPVAQVEQLDRLEEFPSTLQTREELGELSEQFYKYAVQLVEMLDMSVPAVAKLRRLLDSLDRKLGAICRAVAVKVAEGQHREAKLERAEAAEAEGGELSDDAEPQPVSDSGAAGLALPPEMPILIDLHALKDILGPPMYEMEVSERLSQPGVAIGLAWTPLGGEIMFVEASRMDGEGQLTLTGQLGDVMKESAHLAISWLRSNAKKYHLTNASGSFDLLDNTDIHLHFPAGAVTKDGPSAGVTIVTCLASLFSGRLVRSDVAMTGEITLRGLVLPVGGIKDKVLAAHRAGLKRVILPQRNEKDLEEIPGNVRRDLSFVTASCLDEVLNAAFDGGFSVKARPGLVNSKL
uniref:Lon peptidase 2, peroxisomal n=1 Tax=Pipistrellus kuhlii TaxID=59472 RepID=A0A7J7V0M2_PIPKU|nr:lon peptidase 2, peroxisomal [Pipistrellus kuhlii]